MNAITFIFWFLVLREKCGVKDILANSSWPWIQPVFLNNVLLEWLNWLNAIKYFGYIFYIPFLLFIVADRLSFMKIKLIYKFFEDQKDMFVNVFNWIRFFANIKCTSKELQYKVWVVFLIRILVVANGFYIMQ